MHRERCDICGAAGGDPRDDDGSRGSAGSGTAAPTTGTRPGATRRRGSSPVCMPTANPSWRSSTPIVEKDPEAWGR